MKVKENEGNEAIFEGLREERFLEYSKHPDLLINSNKIVKR
jgi:hypothetical protein